MSNCVSGVENWEKEKIEIKKVQQNEQSVIYKDKSVLVPKSGNPTWVAWINMNKRDMSGPRQLRRLQLHWGNFGQQMRTGESQQKN